MKNITYTLIAFFIFDVCNAQISSSGSFFNPNFSDVSWSAAFFDGRPIDNQNVMNAVRKSQLFDLNWETAEIKVGENFQIVEARYNPFNDAIEIKQDDKIFEFAKVNNRNIEFIDTDVTYRAKSFYGSDGKIYTSYFVVNSLADDTTVLKKEWFEVNKFYGESISKYPSVVYDTEKFKKKDYYYFIDENNRIFYLTTDRSLIKNLYPDYAKSIINYIRSNKLKSDDENNMMTLARYIKTLKSEHIGM
jgi:hypothetical protein